MFSLKIKTRIDTLPFKILLIAFFLVVTFCFYGMAAAATWYVDGSLNTAGNGTDWNNAFTTIQAAIDAASKDDEIWLKKGIYELSSQVNVNKSVAMYGGFTGGETQRDQRDCSGNVTTVDGQGSVYHCFYVTADATIDGLFITGGNADGNWPDSSGGGIYNYESSLTITNCTFSGNNAVGWGGGIFNNESSLTITNCTFLNNSTTNYHGGGIYNVASSAIITNCTFSGNSASKNGGGIYNYESSLTITNCTFSGNSADDSGGGIYNYESSPAITNCTFSGNSATSWGGGIFNLTNSSPAITNCTFSGNSADDSGGGIYNYESSPAITNCTFSGNSAANGGGAIYNFYNSSPTIANCILWGDTATTDSHEIYNYDTSSSLVSYCDVQGGYGGQGNINSDPLFADPENGDFHLQATSPCIDKGNNSAPGIPNTDFEGDPRIVDGDNDGTATVDMGMDEYTVIDTDSDGLPDNWEMTYFGDLSQGPDGDYDGDGTTNLEEYQAGTHPANNPPTADAGPDQTVDEGDIVTLDGSNSSDPDDGISSYLWTRTDGPSINLSDPASSKPSFTATSGGTLQFELKVTDKGGLFSTDTVIITVSTSVISDHVWYVDGTAAGPGDGTSWGKAFTTVQAAIDAASKDDEIWLKKGTYQLSSQVNVNKSVAMYGGFSGGETQRDQRDWSGNVTTVDGQGSVYHCFYVTADATIDGLTITGGNADGNWPDSSGGGIFNNESSLTITNCTFSGNSADDDGGGIYNYESSPTITNCTFLNNSSTKYLGGGIYNWLSSPTITNCAFSGNSARLYGGGIYNFESSSPTITNCTFSGNSASNDGGGIFNNDNSSPTITNCILWGDTATDGPEICNYDTSSPIVTYCDIQGGYVGEGNINSDPLFVDPENSDFHLKKTSPCIDKGSNSAPGIPNTDFEGDTRIVDGDNDGTATVDMGADEYTGKNRPPTANAGTDQTVNEGDTVTLDGSSSSDPDDGISSYLWTRTDGPSINLSDPASSKPSFTAPSGGTLQFELKVTDKGGLTAIDTVTITIITPVISDGDVAPLGNRDGTVNVGDALVTLRFALLLETPTQEDTAHGDVAPLDAQGKPNPDGVINVGDALVILRKALGIIAF